VANQTISIGVIVPFGKGVTNKELSQALASEGYQEATAERIFKGQEPIMISMFKVTFQCSTLPSHVSIGSNVLKYTYCWQTLAKKRVCQANPLGARDLATVLQHVIALPAV
jgi:hypothetical protein